MADEAVLAALVFGDALFPPAATQHVVNDVVNDTESVADTVEVFEDVAGDDAMIPRQDRPRPWHDEAVEEESISLTSQPRLKKLRLSTQDHRVSGQVFEERLRARHRLLHPTPSWATLTGKKPCKDNLFADARSLLVQDSSAHGPLRTLNTLMFVRRQDIQPKSNASKSALISLHLWMDQPMVLVAQADGKVCVYDISGDGKTTVLFTAKYRDLRRMHSSHWISDSRVLVTGGQPFFHVLDITARSSKRVPFFRDNKQDEEHVLIADMVRAHPDQQYLAFLGRHGMVALVDKMSFRVHHELRTGVPGGIRDMQWVNEHILALLTHQGQVSEWDVRTSRCVRQTALLSHDARIMAISSDGFFLAIGTESGVVDIYKRHAQDELAHAYTLDNLKNPITALEFSSDGRWLVFASSTRQDQLRIAETKTGKVCPHWPTKNTPLGRVRQVAMAEGRLLIGNDAGRILHYTF